MTSIEAQTHDPVPGRAQSADILETQWGYASFLILGGVIGAAQVGKAVVAIPLIKAELNLGLGMAGLIISTLAGLAALIGFPFAMFARSIGSRPVLIGSMLALGVASLIGGFSQSAPLLIATRLIEGIGLLGVITAVPDLLSRGVAARNRDVVFSIWAAYMPTGQLIMLLSGPALPMIGWRSLWIMDGAVAIAYALVAAFVIARQPRREATPRGSILAATRTMLAHAPSLMLGLNFSLYTFLYFSVAGFLPILLTSKLGLSISAASLFVAGAVAANVVGNMLAGVFAKFGAPLWIPAGISFASLGIIGSALFLPDLPAALVGAAGALALGLSGLAPGTMMMAIPRTAPRPDLITPVAGLVQQGSNIGQFAGPLCTGLIIEHFGWSAF